MKITCKGQVTIPKNERDYFGIDPGTELEMVRILIGHSEALAILKKDPRPKGAVIVEQMRGALKGKCTTAEVLEETRGKRNDGLSG